MIKEFVDYEAYRASQLGSSIVTRLWPVYQERAKNDVEKFMAWWAGEYVLDAGCGDGYTMDIMRDHGFITTGVDFNEEKIITAIKHGHTTCDMDLADMKGFEGDQFDVVYCRHVFEHVIKPNAVLNEFHRVLKAYGKLCMIVPIVTKENVRGKHPHEIPDEDYVCGLVTGAGFTIARSSTETPKYGDEVWIWAEKAK